MFSPSRTLTGVIVVFFLLLNLGCSAPVDKGKRPATSPSSSPGDPRHGESSTKKLKLDEDLSVPKIGDDIEHFIPDSSNDEMSYADVYQMALKRFVSAFAQYPPKVREFRGNAIGTSYIVGVAYFKGVGFAVSTTPTGAHREQIIQEIQNDASLSMLRKALKTSLRSPGPHVEDNLYRILIKEAIKAQKFDPEASRFPDEAKVTIGIHGILPHQLTITGTLETKDAKAALQKGLTPTSNQLQQAPCQTGNKKPSCKAIADELNVTTMLGPPKARPVTPEKQTAGASTAPAPAAAPVTPGTVAGPNQQSPAYSDVSEKDYTDSVRKTLGMQLNPKDPESPSKGAKKDGKKTGGKRSVYRSLMRLSI